MLDEEELPIWDMEKMNNFRFKKISIIPQYAMNAMNPDPQDRQDDRRTASAPKRWISKPRCPELLRRLDLVESAA